MWVIHVVLAVRQALPVYPRTPTCDRRLGFVGKGHKRALSKIAANECNLNCWLRVVDKGIACSIMRAAKRLFLIIASTAALSFVALVTYFLVAHPSLVSLLLFAMGGPVFLIVGLGFLKAVRNLG